MQTSRRALAAVSVSRSLPDRARAGRSGGNSLRRWIVALKSDSSTRQSRQAAAEQNDGYIA